MSSSTVLCLPVPAPGVPERLVGGETTRGTITDVVEPVLFEFVVVDVPNSDGVSFLENGPVDRSFGTERIRVLKMPTDGCTRRSSAGTRERLGLPWWLWTFPWGLRDISAW